MAQILDSSRQGNPWDPALSKATITLISNQEEIICANPDYHARTGSDSRVNSGMSCIVAKPRSDLRLSEICYIELKSGHKPGVVAAQKNGSIHVTGAYVVAPEKAL